MFAFNKTQKLLFVYTNLFDIVFINETPGSREENNDFLS